MLIYSGKHIFLGIGDTVAPVIHRGYCPGPPVDAWNRGWYWALHILCCFLCIRVLHGFSEASLNCQRRAPALWGHRYVKSRATWAQAPHYPTANLITDSRHVKNGQGAYTAWRRWAKGWSCPRRGREGWRDFITILWTVRSLKLMNYLFLEISV